MSLQERLGFGSSIPADQIPPLRQRLRLYRVPLAYTALLFLAASASSALKSSSAAQVSTARSQVEVLESLVGDLAKGKKVDEREISRSLARAGLKERDTQTAALRRLHAKMEEDSAAAKEKASLSIKEQWLGTDESRKAKEEKVETAWNDWIKSQANSVSFDLVSSATPDPAPPLPGSAPSVPRRGTFADEGTLKFVEGQQRAQWAKDKFMM